jgi:hypothetical protein
VWLVALAATAGTLLVTGERAVGAMAAGGTAAMKTVAAAAPYCGITWGSGARSAGALSEGPLVATRTGRHECFDRLVFEFDGPATGFRVAYGEAYTEGEGRPMSPYTAGGAVLSVVLMQPAYSPEHEATYPLKVGEHATAVVGYRTLRDAVFGGSFEGYTTFSVGVRARLPYRVFTLAGPGTHTRIVLDVAHKW